MADAQVVELSSATLQRGTEVVACVGRKKQVSAGKAPIARGHTCVVLNQVARLIPRVNLIHLREHVAAVGWPQVARRHLGRTREVCEDGGREGDGAPERRWWGRYVFEVILVLRTRSLERQRALGLGLLVVVVIVIVVVLAGRGALLGLGFKVSVDLLGELFCEDSAATAPGQGARRWGRRAGRLARPMGLLVG